MSKLIEKLNNLNKAALPALGFRMAGPGEKALSMIVAAEITGKSEDEIENLASAGAVAGIVRSAGLTANAISKYAKSKTDMILGLMLTGGRTGNGWKLITEDIDFIVFDTNTPVKMFNGKELDTIGKVLSLSLDTEPGLLRSVQNLYPGIDAVLVDLRIPELTVETLMICRRVADFAGQHVIALANGSSSRAEILAMREAGVKGLVLPPDVGIEVIRSVVDEIAALPRLEKRKEKKDVVLLPKFGLAPAAKEDDEGDGNGDE